MAKIRQGPRGGRYIIRKGRKVYVKPVQRVRQRSISSLLKGTKENIVEFSSSMTSKLTPELVKTYKEILRYYDENSGRMTVRESLNDVTAKERMYAKLSQAAYKFVSNTAEENIEGFSLLTDFSDDKSVVYLNKDQNKIVIAYRGTIPSKYGDLVADVYITFGKTDKSNRFKDALNKYDTIKNNYPNAEIHVTGHSLGGSQAIFVARKTRVPCWAFNPGQGVSKEYLETVDRYPNIHTLHIRNDPISDTAGLENVSGIILFPAVSKNPLENHSLSNFLM